MIVFFFFMLDLILYMVKVMNILWFIWWKSIWFFFWKKRLLFIIEKCLSILLKYCVIIRIFLVVVWLNWVVYWFIYRVWLMWVLDWVMMVRYLKYWLVWVMKFWLVLMNCLCKYFCYLNKLYWRKYCYLV